MSRAARWSPRWAAPWTSWTCRQQGRVHAGGEGHAVWVARQDCGPDELWLETQTSNQQHASWDVQPLLVQRILLACVRRLSPGHMPCNPATPVSHQMSAILAPSPNLPRVCFTPYLVPLSTRPSMSGMSLCAMPMPLSC